MKYKQNKDYIHRTIAGSDVLIFVGDNVADYNRTLKLNDTAGFLWDRLEKPHTCEELTKALLDEYDVDLTTATQDVKHFLAEFRKYNLVVADE
jgi:hypothetical protein